MVDFVEVPKEAFEAFPGAKNTSGVGSNLTYSVEKDGVRPLSDSARILADKLAEVLDELGLSENLAAGGLPATLAIATIASAAVAVVDEGVPQYARRAVQSLAREVEQNARIASSWSVGAGYGNETLRQRSETTPGYAPAP